MVTFFGCVGMRSSRQIASCSFQADGTGTCVLWDAKTGKPKWEIQKPSGSGGVGGLTVSLDGSRAVFAGGWLGDPGKVFVIDLKSRKVVKTLRGHDDAIGPLAAGPEGLASGSADKHVKFWSWKTGRCYHDLALRGIVRGLMFAPDGSRLAAAGGAVVMAWDMLPPVRKNARRNPVRCGNSAATPIRCRASTIRPMAKRLLPPRTTAPFASGTRPVEPRFAFAPKVGKLHHVAFAPDGLTLAFSSERGHVGLLDLDN